ncbi:DUF3781 domain-containing protein [Treponema sp. OMZ 792]|uniref:DUF3781 domain-containing protein n=1 Tax=unclassified Treponema TaxID=2638727 RepID=UPI0020A55664|nr:MULTISPECIES: DUF3781 domain-containing protein [unclassified Treponema]UTC75967.1 DUF3781 domain-containing protein [Treponema sp. OMZ 792]UTC79967.1 DUF3781 domain-containing protein [Treponema sp. OMZ 798]
MENNSEILYKNSEKIHTTEMGIERIKRNLDLNTQDVVEWCKNKILDKRSLIIRKGKNWYISIDDIMITVNTYSYTIITAHKKKVI